MDYVTTRELREKPGEIWQRVETGEEFVVTRRGKPFALLVRTEPTTVEERLRALRLSRMGKLARVIQDDVRAVGAGHLTDEDIQVEINEWRCERRAALAADPPAASASPPMVAEPAREFPPRGR